MKLTETQVQELLMLVDIKLIELGYYKHGWSDGTDHSSSVLTKIKLRGTSWIYMTSFRFRLGITPAVDVEVISPAMEKVTEDYVQSINEMPEA